MADSPQDTRRWKLTGFNAPGFGSDWNVEGPYLAEGESVEVCPVDELQISPNESKRLELEARAAVIAELKTAIKQAKDYGYEELPRTAYREGFIDGCTQVERLVADWLERD